MNRGLKLVTFDVFNTLIKTRGSVGSIYMKEINSFLKTNQNIETKEKNSVNTLNPHMVEKEFQSVLKHFQSAYPNFGYGKISSRKYWDLIVQKTFKNLNCDFNDQFSQKLTATLYDNFCLADYWEVFSDVIPALTKLKSSKLKIGIISNFDERLPKVLERLELASYFDFFIISGCCGLYKPEKHIYKLALNKALCYPNECLHIGDDVSKDYDGPRSIGMNALIIDRTMKKSERPYINSLEDVLLFY
ncbi:haloacid dehalogenase-like hydrolase domain-containing protein 3 [Hydra vulgaris]|nr:haloacid dehalogenase-like hydrolase domain-containing protein 3 [Hydra vulgaris]